MSSESNLYFGAYCPSGGGWYVCNNSQSSFLGCCAGEDPCMSENGCAAGNLQPMSFDPAYYGKFDDQECSAGQFYTCKDTNPPFLGCCKSNPCSSGCPTDDLASAALSKDAKKAADFLGSSVSSAAASSSTSSSPSSSSSASTSLASAPASATSTSNSTSSLNSATSTKHHSGLPAGAIAGIVVGVVALFGVIAALIWLWRRTSRLEAAQSPQRNDTQEVGAGVGASPLTYDPNVGFADAQYSPHKGETHFPIQPQQYPSLAPKLAQLPPDPRYSTPLGDTSYVSQYNPHRVSGAFGATYRQPAQELDSIERQRSELDGSPPISPTIRVVRSTGISPEPESPSPPSSEGGNYIAYSPQRHSHLVTLPKNGPPVP